MNSLSVASSINGNRFDPSRGAVRVHPEVLKLAGVSFSIQPYYRSFLTEPLGGLQNEPLGIWRFAKIVPSAAPIGHLDR
jgi:hypothetical protein